VKIAYIVGAFPYITETFVTNQIVGMAARGHQVDVYTTVPKTVGDVPEAVRRYGLLGRTQYLFGSPNYALRLCKAILWTLREGWRLRRVLLRSINVFRYGRSAASLALLCAALTVQHRTRARYDIIHCQFGVYGALALRLKEIGALDGRLVVSFRGYDATKYLSNHPHAYDELFRRADLVLPVSGALGSRLVSAGCDRAKIEVHHSGIECDKFIFTERRMGKGEPVKLLSVARLTEKKGMEYAVRAVALLVEAGYSLTYQIVGEGPLRLMLQELIRELGVSAHVQLLGWRDHKDVMALLEQAQVLLAPSVTSADGDEEGIPNAIKEAMAVGVLVLSTWHGGIPELVEDGVSGVLVGQRDATALAQGLRRILDRPEQWSSMGRAARRRVESEFDIQRLNDELLALYNRVIRENETTMGQLHQAQVVQAS
jgi:colanic acid/amylovoran biosynthesis glycosyltransferase